MINLKSSHGLTKSCHEVCFMFTIFYSRSNNGSMIFPLSLLGKGSNKKNVKVWSLTKPPPSLSVVFLLRFSMICNDFTMIFNAGLVFTDPLPPWYSQRPHFIFFYLNPSLRLKKNHKQHQILHSCKFKLTFICRYLAVCHPHHYREVSGNR